VDIYGDPILNYPIMQEIETAHDFSVVVDVGTGAAVSLLRQMITPTEVPFVANTMAMDTPTYMAFYGYKGGIVGLLDGMRGGAEYEYLAEIPGSGLQNMDSMSLGHIVVIAFVLIGNIVSGIQLLQGREDE
jgi:hypothetical protein